MKFWQLLDIFRDEKSMLIEVFSKDKWQQYLYYLHDIENILTNKNRAVLDSQIDIKLLKEVCAKTKKVIYFSKKNSKIYSYKSGYAETEIPLLDAIMKFSHDSIEEVFEKSEADIEC